MLMKATFYLHLTRTSLFLLLCTYFCHSISANREHMPTESQSIGADTRSKDESSVSNTSAQTVDSRAQHQCANFEQYVRRREELEAKREDICQGILNVRSLYSTT